MPACRDCAHQSGGAAPLPKPHVGLTQSRLLLGVARATMKVERQQGFGIGAFEHGQARGPEFTCETMRAGTWIGNRRTGHLERFGRHQAANGGDLVAAAPNAGAAQHPCGALLDATAVGGSRFTGGKPHVLRDRTAAAARFVLGHRVRLSRRGRFVAGRLHRAVDANFVVDGPGDLHADVVLLPRPAGRCRLLVEHQFLHGPPVIDDLVAYHPVLVGRIHRQQVDATGVGHASTIRGQQPPLGIGRVANEGRYVVFDLDRGEVIDGRCPLVVTVEQFRPGRGRFSNTPACSNDRRIALCTRDCLSSCCQSHVPG